MTRKYNKFYSKISLTLTNGTKITFNTPPLDEINDELIFTTLHYKIPIGDISNFKGCKVSVYTKSGKLIDSYERQ